MQLNPCSLFSPRQLLVKKVLFSWRHAGYLATVLPGFPAPSPARPQLALCVLPYLPNPTQLEAPFTTSSHLTVLSITQYQPKISLS